MNPKTSNAMNRNGINLSICLAFLACYLFSSHCLSKRYRFVWEDYSEGLLSLDTSAVAQDPVKKKIVYVVSDGILYKSLNKGLSWRRLVRFRGSSRSNNATLRNSPQFRRLKDKILENKLEELRDNNSGELSSSDEEELRRQAEDEAEDQLKQQQAGSGAKSAGGRLSRVIRRIAIASKNTDILLFASDGGAFLSKDGGKTARQTFRGRGGPESNVFTSVIHPTNNKRMFLGTQKGLWISQDGGKFWKRAFGKLRNFSIVEVRIDPQNTNMVYVATTRSFFVSKDGGINFREKYANTSRGSAFTSFTLLTTTPRTFVLGSSRGIFKAKGNFRFRKRVPVGIGSPRITYLVSPPQQPNFVYALNDVGVFFSKNKGRSFRQLRVGMLTSKVRFLFVDQENPREAWITTDFGVLHWEKTLTGKLTRTAWKRWKRMLRREPTISQMVQKVLQFFHVGFEFSSRITRQNSRFWLPSIRFLGRVDTFRTRRGMYSFQFLPSRYFEARDIRVEARVNWNLSNALSNSQQLSLNSQTMQFRKLRHRLITKTIRLYRSRRRLQLRMYARPPKKMPSYMRKKLKIMELTSHLDSMSNGYLSKSSKKYNEEN